MRRWRRTAPPWRSCPYHNLGCSVVGVTSFHSRRRRRDSSLWPFYSYSRPRGPLSHPSDRSASPCDEHQLSAADRRRGNRRAAESGLSSSTAVARDASDHPLCFCAFRSCKGPIAALSTNSLYHGLGTVSSALECHKHDWSFAGHAPFTCAPRCCGRESGRLDREARRRRGLHRALRLERRGCASEVRWCSPNFQPRQ